MVSTLRREGDRYLVERGDELISVADIDRHGVQAVIHQQVFRFGPSVLQELRGHFEDLRRDLRAEGVEQIVVMTDRYTSKTGRYWRMMGFHCFGRKTEAGTTVHFAVREA